MKLPTAILYLIVTSSQTSQEGCNNFGAMKSWTTKDEQLKHCNNDSTCPTWFTCNSHNSCQCRDEHDYAVVCDNKLGESAVLDCHCVTHERNSGSTYLGLCSYNCQNSNIVKKIETSLIKKNYHHNRKTYSINQFALNFTEQVCCVVIQP